MDKAIIQIQKNLDQIKMVKDGFEFWSARDLMIILGYKDWRKFSDVIGKAKTACTMAGKESKDHFVSADKMVLTGSGAHRNIEDVLLTRLACYLIAQNGDPRKQEISLSQIYFASQTRKQEILEIREKENKRLESRAKLKNTEKKIESTVYERGIKLSVEFATFKNKHIELRAKDFALAMTDHNIKENGITGFKNMTDEVITNSRTTRQALLSRGIVPENLKAEEDIKKIESRRTKEKLIGD